MAELQFFVTAEALFVLVAEQEEKEAVIIYPR